MAWCRPGDKPLSELLMVSLLMHICVTWPQWVNVRKMLRSIPLVKWTHFSHSLTNTFRSLEHIWTHFQCLWCYKYTRVCYCFKSISKRRLFRRYFIVYPESVLHNKITETLPEIGPLSRVLSCILSTPNNFIDMLCVNKCCLEGVNVCTNFPVGIIPVGCSNYYGHWCPGSLRRHNISTHIYIYIYVI